LFQSDFFYIIIACDCHFAKKTLELTWMNMQMIVNSVIIEFLVDTIKDIVIRCHLEWIYMQKKVVAMIDMYQLFQEIWTRLCNRANGCENSDKSMTFTFDYLRNLLRLCPLFFI